MIPNLPARRRMGPNWFRITSVLSIGVVLLATISWAGLGHVTSSIHRTNVFAGLKLRPDRAAGSSINYLLVGSDTREGLSKAELAKLRVGSVKTAAGKRSDTIIMIHISKARDKATIISIPRDTFASVPSWTDSRGVVHAPSHRKINETFGLGDAPLLISTIEGMTNVRIDHYVEVNFAGFAHMVDALGGVSVCLNTAIHDNKSHIDLAAGKHKLDGITALKYVRARYFDGTGDLGRMRRQQKFMGSMLNAATSSGTLLNPIKLLSFINAALATVTTDPDLTRDDLLTLATQLKSLSASSVHMLTVPLSNVNYSADGVYGAVLWDPNLAPELWRRIRQDIPVAPTPTKTTDALTMPPSMIDLAIQNGTNINGLGATAVTDLTKVGFVSMGAPTTALTTVAKTTITYDPLYSDSLRTLKAALPGSLLVARKGQGKTFIVTIGPEYKGIATFAIPTTTPTPTPSTSSPFVVQSGTDAICK